MTSLAVCRCTDPPTPLMATFHWKGYEWLCLSCGGLKTFFGASSADAVPELQERYDALRAEWQPIAKALITPQSWQEGCANCNPIGRDSTRHELHATPQQWQAHEKALEWIKERTGKAVA